MSSAEKPSQSHEVARETPIQDGKRESASPNKGPKEVPSAAGATPAKTTRQRALEGALERAQHGAGIACVTAAEGKIRR